MELTDSVEWQGRTIACARAGTGPDVVFCHGTPFSSFVWSAYADALSRSYTVHVWDMPGYGQSSKVAEHAVDFGSQAEAFTALLAHWGLDRPHVIAHDFGGAVSLQATLNHGAEYASLLLVDVVAIPPSGSPFFRFVQGNPDTLGHLPAYIHEAILRAYVAGASHRGLREEDLDRVVEPWTGDLGQPAFYRQIAQYNERFLLDNEAHLDRLTMPVGVVWGADDGWIPPQTGRRLAGLIAGSRYTEIPGAGISSSSTPRRPEHHHRIVVERAGARDVAGSRTWPPDAADHPSGHDNRDGSCTERLTSLDPYLPVALLIR